MASIKQVEAAILNREGFRVTLTPFPGKSASLPAYDFEYMASNKWKLTDWRIARMARYIPYVRSIEIFRGDGSRTVSDMRLGNLRDTYFATFCAEESAAASFVEAPGAPGVTNIAKARAKRAQRE